MTYFDYPKIGEGYYEERLPDGLRAGEKRRRAAAENHIA